MLFSFFQPVQTAPQQQVSQTRQHNYVMQAGHLIGQEVRVNRGGPDSVEGVLIAIPGDYLVILSNNIIVYVNGAHVKSITEGGKSGGKSDGKSGDGSGGRSGGRSGSRSRGRHSFISAPNFQTLLSRLRHKHIQINRGGPEKLDGFLAEIAPDNALVIVDRELVRIPIFHIKNVSISGKNQSGNKNSNENKNKNENKNENKNSNKSGGNKTGSNSGSKNRTGGNRTGSTRTGGNRTGGTRTGGGRNRNGGTQGRGGRNRNRGSGRR